MRVLIRLALLVGAWWLLFRTPWGQAITGPLTDGWELLMPAFWDDLGRLLGVRS